MKQFDVVPAIDLEGRLTCICDVGSHKIFEDKDHLYFARPAKDNCYEVFFIHKKRTEYDNIRK